MTRQHIVRTGWMLAVAAAGVGFVAGCEDVDWDWEARWWKQQPREVKPDRTVHADSRQGNAARPPASPAVPEPSESPAQGVKAPTTPPPPPQQPPLQQPPPPRSTPPQPSPKANAPVTAQTSTGGSETLQAESLSSSDTRPMAPPVARPEPAPARASTPPPATPPQPRPVAAVTPPPAAPASPPSSPRGDAPTPASGDSFYRVVLASGSAGGRAGGDAVALQNVSAGIAAQILQQLYLPIGLGGGDDDHFMLYQDLDEFQAAKSAVRWVDVSSASSVGGSQGTMNEAMVKLVEIVKSGASPSRQLVQETRAAFERAASGPDLETRSRWAAAMLSGRLAADQLFDYEAARLSYDEAAKLATNGSVEMLSTLWGLAESYDLGGDKATARKEYERIAKEYAGHGRSQAVMRAQTARQARGR